MKKLLVSGFCLYFLAPVHAEIASLQKAMKQKLVMVSAHGTGGLNMSLVLCNNTGKRLEISVDPAMIFRPVDTDYQDMVLLGGEQLTLEPGKEDSIRISTFCGKSYARSPYSNLAYRFLRQGDYVMINVARFIREQEMPHDLIQHAIWSLTNGHDLNNIYNRQAEKQSVALAGYIAKLKHLPVPQFFAKTSIRYQADGRPILLGAEEASVFLNLNVPATRNLIIEMYRADGSLYKVVKSYELQDGGATARIAIDPKKLLAGSYFIRLRDEGNRIWEEKEVRISPAG